MGVRHNRHGGSPSPFVHPDQWVGLGHLQKPSDDVWPLRFLHSMAFEIPFQVLFEIITAQTNRTGNGDHGGPHARPVSPLMVICFNLALSDERTEHSLTRRVFPLPFAPAKTNRLGAGAETQWASPRDRLNRRLSRPTRVAVRNGAWCA